MQDLQTLRDIKIDSLPKTSPRTIKAFKRLGIYSFFDLLNHFPYRYEDYSKTVPISEIKWEQEDTSVSDIFEQTEAESLFSKNKFTIQGHITDFKSIYTRRHITIQQVQVADDSGSLTVRWFNQTYLSSILKPGNIISVSGYVKGDSFRHFFQPESYEILQNSSDACLHTKKLIPIYSQTTGLSSKTIREKVNHVLQEQGDSLHEFLPRWILDTEQMCDTFFAYKSVHQPEKKEDILKARTRLAFNELFAVQLASDYVKKQWINEKVSNSLSIKKKSVHIESLISSLPFSLTKAQVSAYKDILHDLEKSYPMNRLLQGDVGSGKTIVAAIAAYATITNNLKVLLMVPTEILAQQHYSSLRSVFSQANINISVTLHTANNKAGKSELETSDLIIGTHTLISRTLNLSDLGLVIIDEQHKFGVSQRARLRDNGINPHLLTMTATPIPRTVLLTLYGELSVSTLDELPRGRKKIKTHLVPESKREKAYTWIRNRVRQNEEQAFFICPLIDESESDSLKSVKAASKLYEELRTNVFPNLRIGLLHGRLPGMDKDTIMNKFLTHELDILLSTSIVEVGIDVPNATIMLIESAERFGLAQLHQLRGRVGRSDKQSYCYMFTSETSMEKSKRLKYFENEHDGFKLAKFDLMHRGGGKIFGTQQHGTSDLSIASLTNDSLTHAARLSAQKFCSEENLSEFSELKYLIQKINTHRIARN